MFPNFDRYFDYKIFELFRDKLSPIINSYRKDEDSKGSLYKHIFLAPESLSRKRSFQLQGVTSPYVCLWSPNYFSWDTKTYAFSVMRRTFQYTSKEGKTEHTQGWLYQQTKDYYVKASSYFQSFTQEINRDLYDFDRLRYFWISLDELLPSCRTKIELKLDRIEVVQNVDESSSSRSFDVVARYKMTATFPVIVKEWVVNNVNLYLNENLIFCFPSKETTKDNA